MNFSIEEFSGDGLDMPSHPPETVLGVHISVIERCKSIAHPRPMFDNDTPGASAIDTATGVWNLPDEWYKEVLIAYTSKQRLHCNEE